MIHRISSTILIRSIHSSFIKICDFDNWNFVCGVCTQSVNLKLDFSISVPPVKIESAPRDFPGERLTGLPPNSANAIPSSFEMDGFKFRSVE